MPRKSTLNYYNEHYEEFIDDTVSANMQDAYNFFLDAIKTSHPGKEMTDIRILDFGCGSGRDSKYFKSLGYQVDAIDGSEKLVEAARTYAGIEVRQLKFEEFYDIEKYEAIWACASILHMHKEQLPAVLHAMENALKEKGILYVSFKYGTFEGVRNGRYYTDLDEESFQVIAGTLHMKTIKTWITSDVRPGRAEEKWLNVLMRKENYA